MIEEWNMTENSFQIQVVSIYSSVPGTIPYSVD